MGLLSLALRLTAGPIAVQVLASSGFLCAMLVRQLSTSKPVLPRVKRSMPASRMRWRQIRRPWKRMKSKLESLRRTQDTKPFRFCDLPGELRALIYNQLLMEEVVLPDDQGLKIRAMKMLDPKMMLVSHRFGEEYFHEAEGKSMILLKDSAHFGWTPISLPPALQYVRNVEVHLRLVRESTFSYAWHSLILPFSEPSNELRPPFSPKTSLTLILYVTALYTRVPPRSIPRMLRRKGATEPSKLASRSGSNITTSEVLDHQCLSRRSLKLC